MRSSRQLCLSRSLRRIDPKSWAVGALCVALTACSGPAEHADATLARLNARDIQTSPPGARLLAEASDAGSNSSVTGKLPAVQRLFSTGATVPDTATYYRTHFLAYHLAQLPGPEGSQVLNGHLDLDSVVVTISPMTPRLQTRPQVSFKTDRSPTYISVFAIAGGS